MEIITQRLNLGDTGGYAVRKWKALNISGVMATFKMSFNECRFNVNLSEELVEELINIGRWTKEHWFSAPTAVLCSLPTMHCFTMHVKNINITGKDNYCPEIRVSQGKTIVQINCALLFIINVLSH